MSALRRAAGELTLFVLQAVGTAAATYVIGRALGWGT